MYVYVSTPSAVFKITKTTCYACKLRIPHTCLLLQHLGTRKGMLK